MCGIGGFMNTNHHEEHLTKMINALSHRGPDANNFYFKEASKVGLMHTRLSILDLSETANQPMQSHCKRYLMVYNGEIYNYKEIASETGSSFHTTSDSEVILEAFVKWGPDFVNRLNGMFAIAIYDTLKNVLYLFRDRVGIKPLYYYSFENQLIFSSELKGIKSIANQLTMNRQAVSDYFHFGYVPKDETIYENIYKLPAGTYAAFNATELQIKKYWSIEETIDNNVVTNFEQAKNKLSKLLLDSVEKRLISDVPIGTFLSGGTDSSIVTAIASKINPTPLNTFSIGFKEAKYNESEHAKKVASYLKTNHHEFIVSENDVLAELDFILNDFDEPFADSSCFPTYSVSKMARKHITVCLSGDGGDELFMGYGAYNWADRLSNPLLWNFRRSIAFMLNQGDDRSKRASKVFNSPKEGKMSHIFSQEQYLFSNDELTSLLPSFPKAFLEENYQLKRKLTSKEYQSVFDLKNYLKDDLLVKVDRMSMLNSLEVRVPLLDHQIVEFALNLHESLKVSEKGVQKYLLKEVLYEHVPKKLLNHPKWGFSIPLQKWLKTDLKYLIDEYLAPDLIADMGIFNVNYIEKLKGDFFKGDDYLYNRIWQIIVFNKFFLNFRK